MTYSLRARAPTLGESRFHSGDLVGDRNHGRGRKTVRASDGAGHPLFAELPALGRVSALSNADPRTPARAELIACHACDLLQYATALPVGTIAKCRRCDSVLYRHRRNSVDRTLALALAGLILFVVANAFPFLAFRMQGQIVQTTLVSGVRDLHAEGMTPLATLVLLTSVVAPLAELTALLYVLLPLRLRVRPWGGAQVFRLLRRIQPWSMMEVFMLGVLVSLVKLADMAEIVPGIALWSFALLIVVLAAATASLDAREVWSRLGNTR